MARLGPGRARRRGAPGRGGAACPVPPGGAPGGAPAAAALCDLTLAEFRAHYGYAVVGQAQTVLAHLPVLEEVVHWARTKPQLKVVFLDCKVPPARKELITIVMATLRREVEREPVGARFVFLTSYAEILKVMQAVVPAAGRSFDVEIPVGFFRGPRAALCRRLGTHGGERVGIHRAALLHDRRLVDLSERRSGRTSSGCGQRVGPPRRCHRTPMSAGPLSLSRLKHWLPRTQAHSEVVQGTAEFHDQITDALLPQADAVLHDAVTLDTAVDMLDPQPTLVQGLVRHLQRQREILAAWLLFLVGMRISTCGSVNARKPRSCNNRLPTGKGYGVASAIGLSWVRPP